MKLITLSFGSICILKVLTFLFIRFKGLTAPYLSALPLFISLPGNNDGCHRKSYG